MSATEVAEQAVGDSIAIRSFEVGFPEAELSELRRRVNATRWPERETVGDDSPGVRLAMMQDLARYWGTGYDWRACEAKLTPCRNSSPRSTGSTFILFTFAPGMRTRCR